MGMGEEGEKGKRPGALPPVLHACVGKGTLAGLVHSLWPETCVEIVSVGFSQRRADFLLLHNSVPRALGQDHQPCGGGGGGWRSIHFQFIYAFYPQSGVNGCEIDLIFMSILRP